MKNEIINSFYKKNKAIKTVISNRSLYIFELLLKDERFKLTININNDIIYNVKNE